MILMKSIILLVFVADVTFSIPADVILRPFRSARSMHPSPSYELAVRSTNGEFQKTLTVHPSRTSVFQLGLPYTQLGKDGVRHSVIRYHELKYIHDNLYTDGKKASLLILDGKVSGVLNDEHSIKWNDEGSHTLKAISGSSKVLNDAIDYNLTITPAIGGLSDEPFQVEVWVILDYDHAKQFDFNKARILEYLGPFFHEVNARFATSDDWNLQFLISGLTVITDRSQQPWLENNKLASGKYDSGETVRFLGIAVFNEELPTSDLVALLSNTDMTAGGMAYVAGVCRNTSSSKEKKYLGTSVTQDRKAIFLGIQAVAHELGHNMGAPHDGDGAAAACSNEGGYVMSGGEGDHRYYFSKCSQDLIRNVIESKEAECIRTKDLKSPILDPNLSRLPGSILTLNEICKKATEFPNSTVIIDFTKDPSYQCQNFKCGTKRGYTIIGAQEEGSPCGHGGVCQKGLCEGAVAVSLDEQCQMWGDKSGFIGFKATANANVTPKLCSNLMCHFERPRYKSQDRDIGLAHHGTPCGAGGKCSDGTCV